LVICSPASKKYKRSVKTSFNWDCSLTVMNCATLSTPPCTCLTGTQFSNTPNYIRLYQKTKKHRWLYKGRNRADFLRPPQKNFTPATVDINSGMQSYFKKKKYLNVILGCKSWYSACVLKGENVDWVVNSFDRVTQWLAQIQHVCKSINPFTAH